MSAATDDIETQAERDRDARARFSDEDAELHAPVPMGFVIDTVAKAEWAASTLLASEDELARREAELARWKKQHEHLEQFLLAAFDEFYTRNPPAKGKTIHLANAAVGKRIVRGGLRLVDEEAVKRWARAHLPAALVPSFTENLDKELARRGLDALYSKALAEAFEQAPAGMPDEAALEHARQKADQALRAVGASMKDDEERIYVKAPRAPRRG